MSKNDEQWDHRKHAESIPDFLNNVTGAQQGDGGRISMVTLTNAGRVFLQQGYFPR